MNLAAMLTVAVVIAVEKIVPRPENMVCFFGGAAIVTGVMTPVRAVLIH